MGKLIVFFIILFLAIVGVLAFFNKETVDITVWQNLTYPVPIIALIMISAAFGILSMGIIVAVRDTKRYVESWQLQRQQKKEKKIQDSYSRGLEAFYASRYQEATELFTQVTEDEPAHLDALLRLGDISFKEKDFVKAKDFYLKAKDLKPRSIQIIMSLERVSETEQKWQEALKYLDDILEIDSENIQTLHKKRDIFEIMDKSEDLLELQQKILKCKLSEEEEKEENEKLIGYKYELGKKQLEAGEIDKAIKSFKHIYKTESDFVPAYTALADAYLSNGSTKDAEDILLKGFENTGSYVFLAKLEKHYITEGEPGTIIDLYQNAVQKKPKDSNLQFLLAKLYYRLEMIDYAFDTVSSIDATSFDCPDIHALYGSIYERRSEFEKAAAEFKKAVGAEKPLLMPFCCSSCSHISMDWSGRCPECGNWNTFKLDINEVCKTEKRQGSS